MREFFKSIGNWLITPLPIPGTSAGVETLWVELSGSAPNTGQLYLNDRNDRLMLGMLPVRTYGRVQIGRYDGTEIRLTGPGTNYPAALYGPEGIVVLSDDLVIQGGPRSSNGEWAAGICLSNDDMRSLIIALESIGQPIASQIVAPVTQRVSQRSNWDDRNNRRDVQEDYREFENIYDGNPNPEENRLAPEPINDSSQDIQLEDFDGESESELETIEALSDNSPVSDISWSEDGYC